MLSLREIAWVYDQTIAQRKCVVGSTHDIETTGYDNEFAQRVDAEERTRHATAQLVSRMSVSRMPLDRHDGVVGHDVQTKGRLKCCQEGRESTAAGLVCYCH